MKKIFSLLMTILILVTATTPILASEDSDNPNYSYALKLKQLGVFVGTTEGFELDRAATRLEGLIMLIRLLGKEKEALAMTNDSCPFDDVPNWAKGYVTYGFKNGLTDGISSTKFGTLDTLTANQYATFLLRSLQYKDSNGDFQWDEAIHFADSIYLLDSYLFEDNQLTRGEVAKLAYDTLKQPLKTQVQTLAELLLDKGLITLNDALAVDIIVHPAIVGNQVYILKDEALYTLGESTGNIDVLASASIKSREQKNVMVHQAVDSDESQSLFTTPVTGYSKLAFRITNEYADPSTDKIYIKKGRATTLEEAANLPTIISYPISKYSILITVDLTQSDISDITLYFDTYTNSKTFVYSLHFTH